jgi:hypothetical protein
LYLLSKMMYLTCSDGLFMAFLLLQKRIFGKFSYYWEHIVTELRSQAKLANQGAVLFNEISRKRIEETRECEAQTLSKMNQSLKRIAEKKSKLNQSDSKRESVHVEPSEHFQVLFLNKNIKRHFFMIIFTIRSGYYYMFHYESDEEQEKVDERKTGQATVAQEKVNS